MAIDTLWELLLLNPLPIRESLKLTGSCLSGCRRKAVSFCGVNRVSAVLGGPRPSLLLFWALLWLVCGRYKCPGRARGGAGMSCGKADRV